ncbi:SKP1-like protein 14-like [Trifolium pratense]|uniref:SKP1-like protein n=1 Tax=Trifolium pratense TaxID=57577 RepID=A0A2K3LNF1_TRIPR|nr:SKP1-like protein 14-like [Trifolium pratense]
MASSSSNLISLKTSDGTVFKVERALAKTMKTVQAIIEEADANISMIPIHNVFSHHMDMIIDYYKLSVAGKSKEFSVEKLDNDELKDFLLAVHYLNMEDLFEVLTQAVADRLEKKSVGYVRKYFGIENDFTPEEYAAIRKKNDWAFKGDDIEPEEDEEKQEE